MTSTDPIWTADVRTAAYEKPTADLTCDVCVVGAGIAGLTTAYQLAQSGQSVIVLDAKPRLANGETAATTAHLASAIDDRFARVKSVRGADAVGLAYRSHRAAIDFIEGVTRTEGIECDFRRVDGFLFPHDAEGRELLAEEQKVCDEAAIPCERVSTMSFLQFRFGPALRFPDQGQFHPLKYLSGLAKASQARGVRFFANARVEKVTGGSPAVVQVQNGPTVRAKAVVVATNTPLNGGVFVNMRIAAYATYAIAARIPARPDAPALLWDTADPYHYVRTQPIDAQSSWLIVGGEDHKTGQAEDQLDRWERLESWARNRFPAVEEVKYRWDGEVFETPDGLGLIGPEPGSENVFIVTGDSGMGMTHGTIAGLMLPDLIAGRPHPWAGLYAPNRLPLRAMGTMMTESLNMAGQMRDWMTGSDVSEPGEIPRNGGAVVRRGLTKHAVHCRADGTLCELSAVCPHMGGIVRWNAADETWDCPLHGSRFTAEGKLLHGPATDDLAPAGAELAAATVDDQAVPT
jgi:glycine/D-amino acid oxidase-like deaminating enzyme/nitrite reductase/ring-hydroxylating ferredoxin subunit